MKIRIYQVDAFTDKLFSGNPAAVSPLDKWLDDDILQKIAMENNLAETAFYVRERSDFHIKWFTPTVEVPLCGHATLAAAFVLFNYENYNKDVIVFNSRSGELRVGKNKNLLTLDFPTDSIAEIELSNDLLSCFNYKPTKAFKGKANYMVVFSSEDEIKDLQPNIEEIAKLKSVGIIATAKGNEVDFVSRFFAPQSGINEDPATGSSHTTMTPYWSAFLHKTELTAHQLSSRGGYFVCKNSGERTEISGQARLFMTGEINID